MPSFVVYRDSTLFKRVVAKGNVQAFCIAVQINLDEFNFKNGHCYEGLLMVAMNGVRYAIYDESLPPKNKVLNAYFGGLGNFNTIREPAIVGAMRGSYVF